ncbi:MAG: molybdenum cofactor biosynthesis protein MoeA [Planctomycetaceae bacterium]|nr:molybdenum cofactor biosynthesis protein MoeA [Planctomycetaceae bacterium]
MQQVWERIERWLSRNAPTVLVGLHDGATAEEIRRAEGLIGCEFPDVFKQSQIIHNGARTCSLLEYWDFLSLTEIVTAWNLLRDCYDRGFFEEAQSNPRGPIRREWWNPRWIPLTSEPSGNHLCMDLAPADGGQRGQVISWYHDDALRDLVAPTYEAWWEQLATGLEAGIFFIDEEGVLIRKGGPEDRRIE